MIRFRRTRTIETVVTVANPADTVRFVEALGDIVYPERNNLVMGANSRTGEISIADITTPDDETVRNAIETAVAATGITLANVQYGAVQ